jgi:hypothetical protein
MGDKLRLMNILTISELMQLEGSREKKLHWRFNWDFEKTAIMETIEDCQDLIDVIVELKDALGKKLEEPEEE